MEKDRRREGWRRVTKEALGVLANLWSQNLLAKFIKSQDFQSFQKVRPFQKVSFLISKIKKLFLNDFIKHLFQFIFFKKKLLNS